MLQRARRTIPRLQRASGFDDLRIFHNGPSPAIYVLSFFSVFNSNTFTYNVIANFLGVTTTLGHAPGYHYSSRYAGYP